MQQNTESAFIRRSDKALGSEGLLRNVRKIVDFTTRDKLYNGDTVALEASTASFKIAKEVQAKVWKWVSIDSNYQVL